MWCFYVEHHKKCNNKNKPVIMEHFDTEVDLAWTKAVENDWLTIAGF